MGAFLADVSRIWLTGGAGSTLAHLAARTLCQAYRGAASVWCSSEQQAGRLQQWAFFIISPDGHHCRQLEGAPRDVEWLLERPVLERSMHMYRQAAPDVHVDEQQWSFTAGTKAAGLIARCDPKLFAAVPVLTFDLEEVVEVASDNSKTASGGVVHLCMWRRDVVEAIQAQFGLSDAAAVPCKVWRRLGRAGRIPVTEGTASGPLQSFDMAGLLVCWECGAMPAELHQCSRCGIACYCSKECQRANYSSRHRRWCKGLAGRLAAPQLAPCPFATYKFEDMAAAVTRHPQATALCYFSPLMQFGMQLSKMIAEEESRVGQPGDAAASPSHST